MTLFTAAALLFAGQGDLLLLSNGRTGAPLAAYRLAPGERFSVTFVHSVNKSPVTDVYEVRDGRLYAVETVYDGFGAGMETTLQPGEHLSYRGGEMVVTFDDHPVGEVRYIVGTVSDHVLTLGGREISLRGSFGRNTQVRFTVGNRFARA